MTNYEHIKNMSIKELASLLGNVRVDEDEFIRNIDNDRVFDTIESVQEWLEQEYIPESEAEK